jgi:hypothetical protein
VNLDIKMAYLHAFGPAPSIRASAPGGLTRVLPVRMLVTALDIGHWLIDKARHQAAERGTFIAAQNLRKQGVPVEMAVAILGRK